MNKLRLTLVFNKTLTNIILRKQLSQYGILVHNYVSNVMVVDFKIKILQ